MKNQIDLRTRQLPDIQPDLLVLPFDRERIAFSSTSQRVFRVHWFAVAGLDLSGTFEISMGNEKQTVHPAPYEMFTNEFRLEVIIEDLERDSSDKNRARCAHWLRVGGAKNYLYLPTLEPGVLLTAHHHEGAIPTHIIAMGESLK